MTQRDLSKLYPLYEQAFSRPRMNRYLVACRKSRWKAVLLYQSNLRLSGEVYQLLGVFEVLLRNSITRHYTSRFGENWLRAQSEPGGFFLQPGCEKSLRNIQKAGEQLSHDQLVATLGFGFWCNLFAGHEFRAAGSTLLQVFSCKPFNTRQKDIFQRLAKINHIRNRIAHHSPICFDGEKISTSAIEEAIQECQHLVEWVAAPTTVLFNKGLVEEEIQFIRAFTH